MADEPKFSVSEITTFHSTYEQDLHCYRAAGAQGIGIWEFKLPEGKDAESAAKLRDSGLKATTCIPGILSIFPVPFPGPTDPEERTEGLCAAIRRLAAFEPEVILCLTGHPGEGDPREAHRILVEGLRRAARVAADEGAALGLEPLHRNLYGHWSTVATIPETIELLDEVGEPNLKLLYDVYHLWDTDDVLEHTRARVASFASGVHICDWRADTRNDFDRALPGEGIIDLPAILGALEAGGFDGWFDLEIFSDDGSFTDQAFEDSLWRQDALDVVRRGREGFLRSWEARKVPA
jgi:sugar phosphate isomerase/epimerase